MIRVDYAGPGGTCEGMRMLGLEPVGIEWDAAACATRAAAGHLTIRADLASYRPHHAPGSVEGYWASPPCPTFSTAGNGVGRGLMDEIGRAILAEDWAAADRFDSRTRHVLDAARVACTIGADWIGMEQVPPALPLWKALCIVLERRGYSTWAGVLCSADYGVPQTRRRAILMASRTRCANPPDPSHAEIPGLFGEQPWLTMSGTLGWEEGGTVEHQRGRGMAARFGERVPRSADRPAPTLTSGANRRLVLDRRCQVDGPGGTRVAAATVALSRPAPTLTGAAGVKGQWVVRDENSYDPSPVARLSVADALALQSFPAGYPVQGTKTKQFEQVGNAVPPLLAAHVVAALTGLSAPALAGDHQVCPASGWLVEDDEVIR